jgi:hypothetical protein
MARVKDPATDIPEHVRRILEAAGFGEITIQSHDEKVSSGDLDAMTWVSLKVGPLGKLIRENPPGKWWPSLCCVRRWLPWATPPGRSFWLQSGDSASRTATR